MTEREYDLQDEVHDVPQHKAVRILSMILVPFVVIGFFLASLYLMEFDTNPFRTGARASIDDPFENVQQAVLTQGETSAPLTPVTASGGWDAVTAAKEARYKPERPRGYSPDFFSFRYQPTMFAPPEK